MKAFKLAGLLVMFVPVLTWPLLALLAIAGCAAGAGTELICPLIAGIDLHTVPTKLLLFSTKGLAYSIPIGAALLILASVLSRKSQR